MGIAAWLDLDARDMLAFLVAVFFGYIAASALPSGPCAGCGPIVVSYHFFLIWLLLRRHREAGFPLPLLYVLATLTACVAEVAAVAMSEVDHPQVRFLRLGLAALASFECTWLFKRGRSNPNGTLKTLLWCHSPSSVQRNTRTGCVTSRTTRPSQKVGFVSPSPI